MIRSIFIVTAAVIVTAFSSCAVVLVTLFSPADKTGRKIARLWAKVLLLLCRTKVKTIGIGNIVSGRPQILMANHQSDFDILIFLAHIPVDFLWTAKKELFRVPVFGSALRRSGYIEIDRQDREKALKSLGETVDKINKGISIATFPEGTRSIDGKILPFKQGMFHLAIQTGTPIVPVTIIGSGRIMPKKSLKIGRGEITLVIDKPVETGGFTIENRTELIDKVRNIIIANYEKGISVDSVGGAL
jgi:1-acyl-sn-glycerol-3-phosphate acyltransferase